jgi:cupin 2 domain-containing protein
MNIFRVPQSLPRDEELFEHLARGEGLLIERIISTGQTTPAGQWYDQERDEWAVVVQGEATLKYHDGKTVTLQRGDCVFIPAHVKHRVESTTVDPPCIWLAIHGTMSAC